MNASAEENVRKAKENGTPKDFLEHFTTSN